jgi:hypothetical protein
VLYSPCRSGWPPEGIGRLTTRNRRGQLARARSTKAR